jgi:hypothetical protein
MKDVTVALELTLPEGVTDQQIKSFVEAAVLEKLKRDREEYQAKVVTPIDWSFSHDVLGIFEHMIDVVAITDGTFGVIDGLLTMTHTRALQSTLQVNEGGTTTIHE